MNLGVCVCVAACWWVCVCLCGYVLMSVSVFVWLCADECACVCVAACWWVCVCLCGCVLMSVCVCGCMTLNCLSGCLSCKMLLNSIAKIETKYLQCDTEREKLLDLWKGDGSKSFKQVTKSVRTSFFRSWKIVKIFLRTSLFFFHNFFCWRTVHCKRTKNLESPLNNLVTTLFFNAAARYIR